MTSPGPLMIAPGREVTESGPLGLARRHLEDGAGSVDGGSRGHGVPCEARFVASLYPSRRRAPFRHEMRRDALKRHLVLSRSVSAALLRGRGTKRERRFTLSPEAEDLAPFAFHPPTSVELHPGRAPRGSVA